jgi:hypothetical protein
MRSRSRAVIRFLDIVAQGHVFVCPPPLRGQTNTLRSHQLAGFSSITFPQTGSKVMAAGRPGGGRERRVGWWGLGWSGDRQSTSCRLDWGSVGTAQRFTAYPVGAGTPVPRDGGVPHRRSRGFPSDWPARNGCVESLDRRVTPQAALLSATSSRPAKPATTGTAPSDSSIRADSRIDRGTTSTGTHRRPSTRTACSTTDSAITYVVIPDPP